MMALDEVDVGLPTVHAEGCDSDKCVKGCPAAIARQIAIFRLLASLEIIPGSDLLSAMEIETGLPRVAMEVIMGHLGIGKVTVEEISRYQAWDGREELERQLDACEAAKEHRAA